MPHFTFPWLPGNVIFWSRMAAHEALVSLGELEDENDGHLVKHCFFF